MTESPTLLLADINEAAAALTASGKPHLAKAVLQLRDLSGKQDLALEAVTKLVDTAAARRSTSPAGVTEAAVEAAWTAANISAAKRPGPTNLVWSDMHAALLAAIPLLSPSMGWERLVDAKREQIDALRAGHRRKMNAAGDRAEMAAGIGDMAEVSISSTESERHREAFVALNVAIDIFDGLYIDATQFPPANGEGR